MKSVEERWDQNRKRGKLGGIITCYQKCCVSIKSHETLLKILPEDSEYCSLFTGVLKSIVYATANHEKIASSLSQAIMELNEIVARCEESLQLYNTEVMQERLMTLYAHVFDFLGGVLKWYLSSRWRRTFKSFNEDLHEHFREQLQAIGKLASYIRDDGRQQALGAEVRSTRMTAEVANERLERLESGARVDWEMRRIERDEDERRRLADKEEQAARQAALERLVVDGIGIVLLGQATQATQVADAVEIRRTLLQLTNGDNRSRSVSINGRIMQLPSASSRKRLLRCFVGSLLISR